MSEPEPPASKRKTDPDGTDEYRVIDERQEGNSLPESLSQALEHDDQTDDKRDSE